MLAGAAPQVRQIKIVGIVGIMLAGAALTSCRQPRPIAPAPDATAAAPPAVEATPAAPPPRGKQIVIAYSSNLLGEYEPCG